MTKRTKERLSVADRVRRVSRPTPEERAMFRTDPETAAKRIQTRVDHCLKMAMAERAAEHFAANEAADTDRIRGQKWLTSQLTSNDQLSQELETLWQRAEDLFRNDVYAASAVNGRVDNVIGSGIRPQSRVQPERGILTQSQAEEFNTMTEWLWSKWAQQERFYDKQRQLERCVGIYGESWLHMADEEFADRDITLTVQILNPRRIPLFSLKNEPQNKRRRLGALIDKKGRPTDWHVSKSDPYDGLYPDLDEDVISSEDLLHNYEEQFPGQLRGVPWMRPAMSRLKDLKDFAHAHLVAEQVAACYSAFVKGVTDPVMLAQSGRSRSNLEDLAPGTIQYLQDGEDVIFGDPARPGTTLAPYMQWALHGIAASLRYPYELLVKEFTNNFSGGRLALIDGRITFKVWQSCTITSQLRPLWARFVDRCVTQGAYGPKFDVVKYEEHREHFHQHQWIADGWPWVDPEKEVAADVAAIEAGLLTETESLAQRGRDFDETLSQREREQMRKMESQKRLDDYRQKLGLNAVPVETPQSQEPANAPA